MVLIGLALLSLPSEWIEARFGIHGADDGLFEVVLGLAPLLLGVGLLAAAIRRSEIEEALGRWRTRRVRS